MASLADTVAAESVAAGTSDGDSSDGTAGGGTTTTSSVVGVGVELFFLRLNTDNFFMVEMGLSLDGGYYSTIFRIIFKMELMGVGILKAVGEGVSRKQHQPIVPTSIFFLSRR
jgi:hypothetical protein